VTRRALLTAVVAALSLSSIAATPGDVGGCGKTATALDRDRYANGRKAQDCEKCQECGLTTDRCTRACDPKSPPDIALPLTCRPLYQDGIVCLHALEAASCETFATYVEDLAPATPSECDFCRVPPVTAEPSLGDGGPRSATVGLEEAAH
jgi:hypothetical protein